jgi:type III restriction enzyme
MTVISATLPSFRAGGGMAQDFFVKPILNSPYEYLGHHWELDESGQPNDTIFHDAP